MDNCLFCKIIKGEIPCKKIYEDELVLAFLDINPASYGHTLVIPKTHSKDLVECEQKYLNAVFNAVQKIAISYQNNSTKIFGFNYLSNQGKIAGQVIEHFHVHLIPKYSNEFGLEINFKQDENSLKNNDFIDKINIK